MMAKQEEQEPKEQRLEFAKLPPVADLERKTGQRIIALLELLDDLVAQRKQLQTQEEACEVELEALQTAVDRPGFRYGLLCFAAQKVAGRRTLDKMLLMENGCPASVINQSYKQGEPTIRRTFRRLPEE